MSMSGPTANNPATSGRTGSPSHDVRYLRDRIKDLERRLTRMETNRTPAPLQLHELQNATPMSQAPPGHSAVYDVNSGLIVPSPNLASLVFHMQGSLTIATSPPSHARYPCYIVGVSADVSTVGSGTISFTVQKNGTVIATIPLSTASTGFQAVSPPVALAGYTDLVTVATTAIGTGYSDLVVHIELGSNISGNPAPLPQGA